MTKLKALKALFMEGQEFREKHARLDEENALIEAPARVHAAANLTSRYCRPSRAKFGRACTHVGGAGLFAGPGISWHRNRIAALALSMVATSIIALLGAIDASSAQTEPEGPDLERFLERQVLIAFYHATNGPDWTSNAYWLSDAPVGLWHGVVTDGDGRVAGLYLDDNQLNGEIPPELGLLAHLTELSLRRNRLSGEIPRQLGQLQNLKSLRLNLNQLSGEIPAELGNLPNLAELRLAWNRLSGEIPRQLGNLRELTALRLVGNNLSGSIPPELLHLPKLASLQLDANRLSGSVPAQLGHLPELTVLSLSTNRLSGPIPPELGNLAKLEWLVLSDNWLSGPIPAELGNLARLKWLVLSDNQLSGPIPAELGNLARLKWLELNHNRLSGPIPPELGDLADLTTLRLHRNQLIGEIPRELGHLANLMSLNLRANRLMGQISRELGHLARLTELRLDTNRLSGEIPPELGGIASLTVLFLNNNRLSGAIPPELGRLANLTVLFLSNNRLSGAIPPELGRLASLRVLSLGANRLSGAIPPEIGGLANLTILELHYNQLSGAVPRGLGGLVNLTELRLDANRLSGAVPPEFSLLPGLTVLQLRGNRLSGEIPDQPTPVRVAPQSGMPPRAGEPIEVVLTEAFGGREFERPTEVGAYPAAPGGGGDPGAFVAEQEGRILLLAPGSGESAVLLDIRGRVSTKAEQEGLISVALDPRFEQNGHLWLCYAVQGSQILARLSRFSADPQDLRRVDPGSELVVMEVPQPYLNHNCGSIRFGSDGMLYLGLGDGGGSDRRGHGQNPGTLLGSVIRIDASAASAAAPYAVPPDNPFVNVPGARPEIFAYGFRNPWRMAFDSATGTLWAGDVGAADVEEINHIEAGGNYGWSRMEGTRCFNPREGCDAKGTILPVVTYGHELGCAVAGGVVYRGTAIPALSGHYLFSDFCRGQLWALPPDGGDVVELGVSPRPVSSFGIDAYGEVYMSTFGGSVLRITPAAK